jgi:hypothetical protein
LRRWAKNGALKEINRAILLPWNPKLEKRREEEKRGEEEEGRERERGSGW